MFDLKELVVDDRTQELGARGNRNIWKGIPELRILIEGLFLKHALKPALELGLAPLCRELTIRRILRLSNIYRNTRVTLIRTALGPVTDSSVGHVVDVDHAVLALRVTLGLGALSRNDDGIVVQITVDGPDFEGPCNGADLGCLLEGHAVAVEVRRLLASVWIGGGIQVYRGVALFLVECRVTTVTNCATNHLLCAIQVVPGVNYVDLANEPKVHTLCCDLTANHDLHNTPLLVRIALFCLNRRLVVGG